MSVPVGHQLRDCVPDGSVIGGRVVVLTLQSASGRRMSATEVSMPSIGLSRFLSVRQLTPVLAAFQITPRHRVSAPALAASQSSVQSSGDGFLTARS